MQFYTVTNFIQISHSHTISRGVCVPNLVKFAPLKYRHKYRYGT